MMSNDLAPLPTAARIGALTPASGDRVIVPQADKAITQRATILAAMARGSSRIIGPAACNDCVANVRALTQLGIPIRQDEDGSLEIEGTDWHDLRYEGTAVQCDNSATTSRILLAALAGTQARCTMTGNAGLRKRPMAWVVDPLRSMGAVLDYLDGQGRLPTAVRGRPLKGGTMQVLRVDSAQAVSALAFAALLADGPTTLRRRSVARDHTERLLRWTGVRVDENRSEVVVWPGRPSPFTLAVPSDPSEVAYLVALHLASPNRGSWLRCPGTCINPRRLGFFRILEAMGADVDVVVDEERAPEDHGTVSVRMRQELRGAQVRGAELIQASIDEIPLVAALATQATSPTTVADAKELQDKDTDRITMTVALLRAFGGRCEATRDGVVVQPSVLERPIGPVALPADHRIAFAALVLGVLVGGHVAYDGVAAIGTSNPSALIQLEHFATVAGRTTP